MLCLNRRKNLEPIQVGTSSLGVWEDLRHHHAGSLCSLDYKGRESKKRKRQRHGLCRRRDKLQARVINIEKRLEENQVRVCFGGRKLARAGNHPEVSGYKDHTEWRARWDRKRSGVIYVKGDSEASHGNCCAKIILDPDGQDKLRLRIPDLSLKLGDGSEVALRDLSDGAEWVELLVEGFVYGRGEIKRALEPYESASEEKARWYVVASTSPL